LLIGQYLAIILSAAAKQENWPTCRSFSDGIIAIITGNMGKICPFGKRGTIMLSGVDTSII
jgi:hypothetical protein